MTKMKKANALVMLLSVLLILVAVNFLASRHPARLDLTQNKIYTLSDSTRRILSNLDDVVTIRAYFTKEMPPALQNLKREVEDMLAEFKSEAGSRLQVEFIDPATSVMEEQQASMLGIPPVQMNVVEQDRVEVAKVHLGIGVFFSGRHEVIPVIQRIDNLEYDLAEAILKVSSKELPRIAWWEGEVDKAQGAGFEIARSRMSRRYEVVMVDDEVKGDLEAKKFGALVLLSPGKLSPGDILAIDSYLMGGGRIVALIDRFSIADGLRLSPVETDAVPLFAHYGAKVEDSLVVDGQNAMAAFADGGITYHLPYPYWPEVRKDRMDASSHIVAGLESIVLPWTSPLEIAAGEANSAVLLGSTDFAAAISGSEAKLDPQSARAAITSGKRGKLSLAAGIGGPFASYSALQNRVSSKSKAAIEESQPGARIFVVGSSHWAADRTLSTFPQNAAFLDNAVDSMAMGDELIGIRSRESALRPIAPLTDGARALFKAINMAAGPLILLIIGAAVFFARRRGRRAAISKYR